MALVLYLSPAWQPWPARCVCLWHCWSPPCPPAAKGWSTGGNRDIDAFCVAASIRSRSADGHIHVKSPDFNDVGTYRITDDGMFCTKYNKIRGGQETCQIVWQTGPDTIEAHLPNGQVAKVTAMGLWKSRGALAGLLTE